MNEPDETNSTPTEPDLRATSRNVPAPEPLSDSAIEAMLAAQGPRPRGRWQPPTVEELQRLLPQYEIRGLLGRSGMGAVYRGIQRSLDREVAIKILPPGTEDDDSHFPARFKREAKAMARLSHPGIVAVFEAGETPEGLLYFVMEYIEGTDVQRMVAGRGALPAAEVLPIIAAVCDALQFAHESGLLHRDIKPANIMVDFRGQVKVADFGLAKTVSFERGGLTMTDMVMGTPDFVAPEAFVPGLQLDQRADIYAVGVMLYQMLTGHIPRGCFTMPSGVIPQLDPRLDTIVSKALQTDRDLRYTTARELRTDLDRVLTAPLASPALPEPSSIPIPPLAPSPQIAASPVFPAPIRNKVLLGLSLAAVLVSIAAFASHFWKGKPEPRTSAPAQLATPAAVAAEPWVDLLKNPKAIHLLQKSHLDEAGHLILGKDETVHATRTYLEGRQADGAIRMRIIFDPTVRPTLKARGSGARHYGLDINSAGDKAWLSLWGSTYGVLRGFPLPQPLREGAEYELELRCVGNLLTVRLNGRELGQFEDTTLSAGPFGVVNALPATATITGLEYLDLTGTAKPAAQKAGAGKWVNVLSDPRIPGRKDLLELSPAGLTILKKGQFLFGSESVRDRAIRSRIKLNDTVTDTARLMLRLGPRGHYQAYLEKLPGSTGFIVQLQRWDVTANEIKGLGSEKLPSSIHAGDSVDVEFRAIGMRLLIVVNGARVVEVETAHLTDGSAGLANVPGARTVETLEYLDLDDAPPVSRAP